MGIFPGAKSNSAGDQPVAKVTALTTALKSGALAEPTGRYSAILKERMEWMCASLLEINAKSL